MVTREQILETQRKCNEIRKKHQLKILNEDEIKFNSIEEAMDFFHAEPLDEFEKRFRSGACESEDVNAVLKALGVDDDFDYHDNHPNEMIAISMEIIIQIGNSWDDGARTIVPDMKQHLFTAISRLEEFDDKTSQINSLIRNGKYYLNNMKVVEIPS